MCDLTIVKVQEIGRGIVCLKRSEILHTEMRARFLARQNGEEKRNIRVIAVQQIKSAKVLSIVSRHRREVGIQLVVGLGEQIPVEVREDAAELPDQAIDR